jgi:flagellar biosynthesis anti-sigma factor FlgM
MSLKPISTTQVTTPPFLGETQKKAASTVETLNSDETRLSASAATLSSAGAGNNQDVARLEALRAQIADGTYRPNPKAIAEKLLQEAWLIR